MPNEGITKDENELGTPTPPLPPPRGRVRWGGQLYLRVKITAAASARDLKRKSEGTPWL